jgi:hypothetical protein
VNPKTQQTPSRERYRWTMQQSYEGTDDAIKRVRVRDVSRLGGSDWVIIVGGRGVLLIW